MKRSVIGAVVGISVLSQGCGAGWRRRSALEPGPFSPRQQAQVWHQGRAEHWHALIVSPDSISGVPYLRPPDCDSCRVVLLRAQVDSVRFGNPVAGFWKTAGLVVGIPVLVLLVWCASSGGGPPCSHGS